MGLRRLTHIGICVSDRERSLRFYRDILGFAHVSDLEVAGEPTSTLLQIENVALRATYLERDGVRIELLHYPAPGHLGDGRSRPMNQLGLTHLSFRVNNLAATIAALRESGVCILERTHIDIPAFDAAAVFITDPDGTLIELVQAPES